MKTSRSPRSNDVMLAESRMYKYLISVTPAGMARAVDVASSRDSMPVSAPSPLPKSSSRSCKSTLPLSLMTMSLIALVAPGSYVKSMEARSAQLSIVSVASDVIAVSSVVMDESLKLSSVAVRP